MPVYRSQTVKPLCSHCGELATRACSRCGAPSCGTHQDDHTHYCAACARVVARNRHASIGLGCGVLAAISLLPRFFGVSGLLPAVILAAFAPAFLGALRFGLEGLRSERWWQAALGLLTLVGGIVAAAAVPV